MRRQLLALITAQQPQAHIYVASVRYEPAARADCLKALVRFAVISGANRLVFERDETRADDDRDVLTQSMRAAPGHVPWEVSPPA